MKYLLYHWCCVAKFYDVHFITAAKKIQFKCCCCFAQQNNHFCAMSKPNFFTASEFLVEYLNTNDERFYIILMNRKNWVTIFFNWCFFSIFVIKISNVYNQDKTVQFTKLFIKFALQLPTKLTVFKRRTTLLNVSVHNWINVGPNENLRLISIIIT